MKTISYIYMATDYHNTLKIGHTTALSVRKSQLKKYENLEYFRSYEFTGDRVKREMFESILRYAIATLYNVEPYQIDHYHTDIDTIHNIDMSWNSICALVEKEYKNVYRAFKRAEDKLVNE